MIKMKEAPNSPYAKLVFRETFNDEQSVRSNGGVPTEVTFEKGIASFNGTTSYIKYNKNLNGVYSIRIRCKVTAQTASVQYLFDARGGDSNGTGYAYLNAGIATISSSSGTIYVNGVAAGSITYGSMQEIVITGISLVAGTISGQNTFALFNRHTLNIAVVGTCDLFEIYQGTLTASEVKNLYDNDWNKEVAGYNGQAKPFYSTDFSSSEGWALKSGGWKIENNKLIFFAPSSGVYATRNSFLTRGKTYIVSFDLTISAGTCMLYTGFSGGLYNATTNGRHYHTYTVKTTDSEQLAISGSGGGAFYIENLIVQELQPNLLLDYDSTNGYITDRTGKNTLTPTAVTIKKTGSYYSADFNGVTSKIDTGSDFIGTKAITVCGWIYNTNSIGYQRILDNSKFRLGLHTMNTVQFTSDQVKFVYSLKTVPFNSWQFISLTRKVDGKVSFYLGDKSNSPVLNGSVDLDSGTPTVAASNVFIGSHPSGMTFFYGNIPMLKVYEGILDLETITQIWSSTRGKVL